MFESEGGHNFRQLKEAILTRSVANDWEVAKREWKLVQIYEADEPDTCLCGHTPIIEICVLANKFNGRRAEVGNRCVKRFLGLRSDLIFAGVKRIRADSSKSLNTDSSVFFYEQGIINKWEYDFQGSTQQSGTFQANRWKPARSSTIKYLLTFSGKASQSVRSCFCYR